MKLYLASVDIDKPVPTLWGTDSCDQARLLVRTGAVPLDEIWIPLDASRSAFAARDLKPWLEGYIPVQPRTHTPGHQPLPAVSVVVCTRDRPNSLAQCLEALGHLRYPEFEVIVVDNASQTEDTRRVVEASGFRYVREDRPGLDWARNRGWISAKHDLVAYVDDDACVDPDWLAGIGTGFADPEIGAVTGLVLPAEVETYAQHLFEDYGGMSKDLAPKRFRAEKLTQNQLIRAQDIGVGANMAFRKSVLRELDGFDTALDVGTPSCGGGDLEMLHRVLAAGKDIAYQPTALVRHRHRRDIQGLYRQIRNNGRGFGVYLMTLWRKGTVRKTALLRFAIWNWGRWLLSRPLKKLFGRHRLPMRMLIAELGGAVGSPFAYWKTLKSDQRIRRSYPQEEMVGSLTQD